LTNPTTHGIVHSFIYLFQTTEVHRHTHKVKITVLLKEEKQKSEANPQKIHM